jgi:hypothetical protein
MVAAQIAAATAKAGIDKVVVAPPPPPPPVAVVEDNTKLYLGIGVVGLLAVGYYMWMQKQTPKSKSRKR